MILPLVFAFAAFVTTSGFAAGCLATSGSVAGCYVGSRVGILSKFFIGNNLLLKLLRTFSLALSSNTKLFQKGFLKKVLYLFQNYLIH